MPIANFVNELPRPKKRDIKKRYIQQVYTPQNAGN